MKKNLRSLEQKLKYQFSNPDLLEQALSHRSYAKANNERLEFLGDSLINFFMAEAVFQKYPQASEGELSRLRSHLVKGETLAEVARLKELGDFLLLGEGELKSGGFRRASILADAVEAIIGAMYLDSNLDTCRAVVCEWFADRIDAIPLSFVSKDPKTLLQEYQQERGLPLPSYSVVSESGVAHAKEYVIECCIGSQHPRFSAQGANKRQAEKEAARAMLVYLGERVNDE